jgi:hypothetical protein
MNASNPNTITKTTGEYDSPLITPSEDGGLVRGRATTVREQDPQEDSSIAPYVQVELTDATREFLRQARRDYPDEQEQEQYDSEFDLVDEVVVTPEAFTAKVAAPCGCEEYIVLDLERLDEDDRADAAAILTTLRELILRNYEEAVEDDVPVTQIIVVE